MYGGEDNDHDIPPIEGLCTTKTASYGTLTTNTFHGARNLARLLEQAIKEKCRANGLNEDEINIFVLDCHNHLWNIWIGAMNKALSNLMKEDLESIDSMLRVTLTILV